MKGIGITSFVLANYNLNHQQNRKILVVSTPGQKENNLAKT